MLIMLSLLFVILVLICTASGCPPQPDADQIHVHQFIAALPSGCHHANCTFRLAVAFNKNDPEYLDFWMEGNTQGYIAVGLSSTGYMGDSDVLMCGLDPITGNTGIVDAYNTATVMYNSVRDTIQNLCPHFADARNGRISCSFSRLITTEDSEDKNLDGHYYLLLAAVDTPPVGSGGTLAPSYHNVVPTLSAQPVNIVQFLGESHTTTGLFSAESQNTCQHGSCDSSHA